MNLSSKHFFKLLASNQSRVSEGEIKVFKQQWITGRGLPKMKCGFLFNKKRQQSEFAFQQIISNHKEPFINRVTIRINEIEASFNHSIPLKNEYEGYDFQCHSKLRKNKKKKIKYLETQDENEIDLSRRESPILWIRIDPYFTWGPYIEYKQPDYMWAYQLEYDPDIIAQLQSIHSLAQFKSTSSTTILTDVLSNPKSESFPPLPFPSFISFHSLPFCSSPFLPLPLPPACAFSHRFFASPSFLPPFLPFFDFPSLLPFSSCFLFPFIIKPLLHLHLLFLHVHPSFLLSSKPL